MTTFGCIMVGVAIGIFLDGLIVDYVDRIQNRRNRP